MKTKTNRTKKTFWNNLFEESALAKYLHIIFQNQHIMPGVVMGFRTPNDPVTDGEREFMLASTRKAYSEGDTPVKICNFSNKKEAN
jgi:hypothetical protein